MDVDTQRVLQRCRELGFALAGVTSAAPTQYAAELKSWLNTGQHGEMTYLARNVDALLDPQRVLPGAVSIICVADRYHTGDPDRIDHAGPPRGRIARYARGDDYHIVIKKRLHALCDELAAAYADHAFRACVDTAPVLEREYAMRAGLGAIGKHTLLIEQGAGSYLLLGEVLTTMPLTPARAQPSEPIDPCGSCTRCIEACPTNAISPWSVDGTRCISYLTIEHRSEIDASLHAAMGDWLFGCDICQEVCPHNQPTRSKTHLTTHEAYAPRDDRRSGFPLLDVLNWDETARRSAFTGSSMKRAKLAMMKRNAVICAGNALRENENAALRTRIEAIAADPAEDDLVRHTAQVVINHNSRTE